MAQGLRAMVALSEARGPGFNSHLSLQFSTMVSLNSTHHAMPGLLNPTQTTWEEAKNYQNLQPQGKTIVWLVRKYLKEGKG